MVFVALPGQFNLLLTFLKTGALPVVHGVKTVRAGNAFHVALVLHFLLADRHPAGVAHVVIAHFQPVFDRNPLVEDKTLAFPKAFLFRHRFEVFQDAAFQVIYLVKTLRLQQCRRFFATNATGAEHRDLGIRFRLQFVFDPCGQFAKACCLRVLGVFESTDGNLVIVAGIDHDDIWLADQRVPVLGVNIGSGIIGRVHAVHTQRHDFFFQAHLHSVEGRILRPGKLGVEIGEFGV